METIGERIGRMRELRELTQEQVGDAAGVSREAVSQWIKNKAESIPSRCLMPLAKLFRMSIEELLTGDPIAEHSEPVDAMLFAAALDDAEREYKRTDARPDTLQRVKMAFSYYDEYLELRQGRQPSITPSERLKRD